MATIYVRTTGNDTTGTGLTGAPYLTLKKALSVAANGDTILLGDGTYAEDSGGGAAGYLNITQTFTSRITITSESGTPGKVIVKGSSSTANAINFNGAQNMWYDLITFEAQSATVNQAIRFAGGAEGRLIFTRCEFVAYSSGSQTNMAVKATWSAASVSHDPIVFERCTFRQIGPNNAGGMFFDFAPSDGIGTARVEVRSCVFNMAGRSMQLPGMAVWILDNVCTSWMPTSTDTCFVLGVDGTTGRPASGIVAGNTFRSRGGHGAVLGAGCDGVLFANNRVYGGDGVTTGQGLVVKQATNVRVERNIITSGYLSGLYFKAATNCQAFDNTIFNEFPTSSAIKVGVDPVNSAVCSGIVVRRNYVHAIAGPVLDWASSSGDSGGSVCDENVYNVTGTATLGSVRGTTVSTLTGLRAAWGGYNRSGNDRNSQRGQAGSVFAGARVIELP